MNGDILTLALIFPTFCLTLLESRIEFQEDNINVMQIKFQVIQAVFCLAAANGDAIVATKVKILHFFLKFLWIPLKLNLLMEKICAMMIIIPYSYFVGILWAYSRLWITFQSILFTHCGYII